MKDWAFFVYCGIDMATKEVTYHKHKDSTRVTRKVLMWLILGYILLVTLKNFGVIQVQDFKVLKIEQQQKAIEVQQQKMKALQKELKRCKSENYG